MAVVTGKALLRSNFKLKSTGCCTPKYSGLYLFLGSTRMKNIFKKGLVVLLATLFVTSVFAAEATTTAAAATKTATPAHVVNAKKHCVKKCKMHHKKNCKKKCKMHHKKAMTKAETHTNKAA